MTALFDLALVLGGIFVFALLAGGPIFVGAWILLPLDRVAKQFRRPTRFSILDFFGLVFLVQMPMALIHGLVPRGEAPIYWTLMIMGWFASAAVWAAAVKTFSNAGIERVWTRAQLVFFVLPMAYFAPFAIVIMCIVAINIDNPATSILLFLISAACAGGVIVAGVMTRKIARPIKAKATNPFGDWSEPRDADDTPPAFQAREYAYLEAQKAKSVAGLFQDDAEGDEVRD